MAFNGSGTFLRVMNWTSDAQADIDIRADRHDTQDDDFASGLSNAITRDGQTQPTNDIPMNGHKITNLGTPVSPADAVTKAYADTAKPYTGGVEISGADVPNGAMNFSSLTGANGLSFKGADLAWLARLATAAGPGTPPVPPATLNRLVLNTALDGSGTDVVVFNDDGSATFASTLTVVGAATFQTSASFKGALDATGIGIKPLSGNGVVNWYAADGTSVNMQMYTGVAAGHGYISVQSKLFTFGNNGIFVAPNAVQVGGANFPTDANISGGVWDNWGAHDSFSAISAQIERRGAAFANDRVANLQFRKTSPGQGGRGVFRCPAGAVLTGIDTGSGAGEVFNVTFHYLQSYDQVRGWVTFQG